MTQGFDLFGVNLSGNVATSETKKQVTITDSSLVCEAIQILRVLKSVMGNRRECIDTIKIDGAKMTYERAMKIAKAKAEKIGNCMVVEKLERVIVTY